MSKVDYTIEICVKMVQTHSVRKKRIIEAMQKRASLTDTLQSMSMSHMPKGKGTSNPTEKLYEEIEHIETYIAEEEYRVGVVEEAMERIGSQYDAETQKGMRDGIMIHLSPGKRLPFAEIPYPFERDHFYAARKEFLRDIAKQLYLLLD